MADNNSKKPDDTQLNANSKPPLSAMPSSSSAENGSSTGSGTQANAAPTAPAPAPQSSMLPPIGHLIFSFDLLGNNGENISSGPGFPLHPPMVMPPALMGLMEHFAQSLQTNPPANGTTQTQVNAPIAVPEIPEEVLVGAINSMDDLVEDVPDIAPLQNALRNELPQRKKDRLRTYSAFIESLKPVDINSLDDNNRKCAICWKVYGEAPDPGLDNSEHPVKLPCSHVYGGKCVKQLFGGIENTFKLTPLSFDDPKSRACELGRMLDAFLVSAPAHLHEKLLFDALDRIISPRKGRELFGKFWWTIFDHIKSGSIEVSRIVLKENAVVLDLIPQKKPTEPSWVDSEAVNSLLLFTQEAGLDLAHPEDDDPLTFEEIVEYHMQPMTQALEKLSHDEADSEKANQYDQYLKDKAAYFKARDRMKHRTVTVLARELKSLYQSYLSAKPSLGGATRTTPRTPDIFQVWVTEVIMHKSNANKSSLNTYIPGDIYRHGNSEEADEADDAAGAMVISRIPCVECFDEDRWETKWPDLESASWKNLGKIPDNCPLCHKVLFRRQRFPAVEH